MAFTFFDHTGDIGVQVTAATLDELFGAAATALAEILCDRARIRASSTKSVSLEASTLETLLVDWLNELLYEFEVHELLVGAAQASVRRSGDRYQLAAVLQADSFDPSRHLIKVLVKAVTYHRLHVDQTAEGWRAAIVFDI